MVRAMGCKVGNPARKLVLLKLADNANDEGMCFPSYDYIAEACEMSRRSAINHISDLEEMGLISKKIRRNTASKNSSNVYFLTLNNGEKVSEVASADSAPLRSFTGENSALGGADSAPLASADSAPITSHSFNQSLNHITQRARKPELIDPQFSIDNDVRVAMQQAGVQNDLAEWCIVEFVTSNVAKEWKALNWPTEFVRYCKRQEVRFIKHQSGTEPTTSSAKTSNAEVIEFIQSLPDSATKRVFVAFMRYENKFFSKLREETVRDALVSAWDKALAGLTENQLNYGLSRWRDAWPADAAEFRGLCLEVKTPVVTKADAPKTEAQKQADKQAARSFKDCLPANLRRGRAE